MTTAHDLPEPLVPADADLRDFTFMPIDIVRLFGSDFHAKASDGEWRAGVTLWLKSWHQVPAGSLPDDEIALARLAEFGRDIKAWKKVRDVALYGWRKCSDGRLYHRTVAEKANEAWSERTAYRKRKAVREEAARIAAAARWGKADDQGDASAAQSGPQSDPQSDQQCEPHANGMRDASETQCRKGQGQGQGKEIGDRRSLPQPRAPAPARLDDAQAEALIAAADRVIAEHFGRPRPRRHRDDAAIARVWAARGIVPDRLAAILDAAVGRYAAGRPGDLPVSLRLFETDVDREEPPSPYPPGITSADDRQWWDRVVVWRLKGAWFERNGPPPDDPGTLVPDRVLVGHGLNRRKDAAA